MFLTHLVLIGTNQTTVEHLAARNMKDRENATLDEMYSCYAFRFVPFFLLPHHRLYGSSIIGGFSGKRGVRDEVGM
jgi:hypothetical protein